MPIKTVFMNAYDAMYFAVYFGAYGSPSAPTVQALHDGVYLATDATTQNLYRE